MSKNWLNFSKVKIVVIGDVMLDQYWQGSANRLSPEAPIPIINVENLWQRPGGASNVATNLSSLGATVDLFGVIGKDEAGETLTNLLQTAKVNTHFQTFTEISTIRKLRVVSHNQQIVRLDFEKKPNQLNLKPLLQEYAESIKTADLVIISDYAKGINQHIHQFMEIAKAAEIPILVDPKNGDFSPYEGAMILKPNLAEFEKVAGHCSTDQDLEERARALMNAYGFKAFLITRGAKGMSLITKQHPALHIPAYTQEVFDVTGAGDTVIAVLGLCLASGESLIDAAKISNIAASIVVKKMGVATLTLTELRRSVQRHENSWCGITGKDHLLQEVANAKLNKEVVVMTNGCFDILHAGHVAYLEQAKSLGDRLIVAINDDISVRRLKGATRPINNLMQRTTLVSGLRAVDWVIPFSEDTPESLIKLVNPDILVKGGDYKIDDIAGAKHVLSYGGRVEIIPLIEGCSSSSIIEKIKRG